MRKTHLYFASLTLVTALAACNGNTATSTISTDSTSVNPGDSSVTTTTTTVTTHRKYAGSFAPKPNVKYLDLRTHKEVTVRIDTVRGEVVNTETNEPLDLFVEPTQHDTIYGLTGSVVNNYIIKDESGDYRVDTVRINTITPATEPRETAGDYKVKVRGDKTKVKTEDEKIKEKNGIIKTKER